MPVTRKSKEQKAQEKQEAIDRLKEIKDEMMDLISEADALVRKHADNRTYNCARAYWIAHITMALTNEHDWMGSDDNLEDTIKQMEGRDDEE